MVNLAAWMFVSFIAALLLTWCVRRVALAKGTLDQPNARSSHIVPTPRGGGFAIVASSALIICMLAFLKTIEIGVVLGLLMGGTLVAIVGFLDDRNAVSVCARFVVHVAAAISAVWMLGGLRELPIGAENVNLGIGGQILAVIAIIWALNLFNFMDGIDGIAASEAIFVLFAGSYLSTFDDRSYSIALLAVIIAAACFGFLVWNWPPAKIFMGDVGSGYLGYVIAVLALAASRTNGVMIYVWLILGGVFFVDATVTLVRRLLRGERVYVAHRSHAYQWLSRRWNSHLRVTLLVWAINLFWLLPLAWLCLVHPSHAIEIVFLALTPLVVLSLIAGAGKKEIVSTKQEN